MIACTVKNIYLLNIILGRFLNKGVLSLDFVSFTKSWRNSMPRIKIKCFSQTIQSLKFEGILLLFIKHLNGHIKIIIHNVFKAERRVDILVFINILIV